MEPKIVYRKLRVDELGKLRDLFGDDPMGLWPKYLERCHDRMSKGEMDTYVFEINDDVVGELTVNYVPHLLPNEAIRGQRAFFSTFRVMYRMRGLGIGQELMNYAIEDLTSKGYSEFTVAVEADNPVANHVYAKFGFTEPIDQGHGDEFDPVDYVLFLRPASANAVEAEIVG